MKARRGEGTWEQRGPNSGRLRVMSGRDAEGKRQYLDFTAGTEAEARGQYETWKIEKGIRGYAPPIDRFNATFAEFLPVFYEELDRLVDSTPAKMQPRTRTFYRETLDRFALPVLGHLKVRELRVDDLHRCYAHAQANARKGKQATDGSRTAKAVQQSLQRALAYAERCDYAARNVAEKADSPTYKAPKRQPPTGDELKRLRETSVAAKDHLLAWWALAATGGMRPGEMLGLERKRVDLDAALIDIEEARETRAKPAEKPVKSEAGHRQIPLTAATVEILRAHLDAQAFVRRKAKDKWEDNDLVFCTRWGRPLSYRNVYRAWEKARDRAELPEGTRPYDLRHAYISELLAEGIPLQEVSWLAGHADPYFTARVYGHLLERRRPDHRAAIERALGDG